MSLTFTRRESAFEDLEDVFRDELYLGWIAPARHGKRRDWWLVQPVGERLETVTGRDEALKVLQSTRRANA